MRKHTRAVAALSIVLMLVICVAASLFYGARHFQQTTNSYAEPLPKAPDEADPLEHIGEDFVVDSSFTSHLPIVILDMNGEEPPIHMKFVTDDNGQHMIAIDGVEPYISGTMTLLSSENSLNHLGDEPQLVSKMRIKRRGNSSLLYEKAQYMVKLETESGQNNDVNVLGMGYEHEWILNGSMYDKSMIRNYLSYSIASEVLPYTPDSKICEVLIKKGDSYYYQGVYLLMESISQGPDRVDIADFSSSEPYNSYLVRRDRYDADAITLDTYANRNGLSSEYMSLLYPTKREVTQGMLDYVQCDLNKIEQVLYSDSPEVFSTYSTLIDVDSFVDYFLTNEFLINYDAGNNSTYFYKNLGGKLCMGPVWDYDGAMDNYQFEPIDTDHLAFYTKPWFQQLCQDLNFVEALEKRYAELRRSTFSWDHINGKIDEIIAYLGGAQEREWARWGHWYCTENKYSLQDYVTEDGDVLYRNAVRFEDEIYRLKSALHDHGEAIPGALEALEVSCTTDTGASSWRAWLLLLAAAVFFIPAYYVGYRK